MAMGTVGVAPGTTTFKTASGEVVSLADWVDDRYYGTVQFSNGVANQLEAFSSTRSQQIPGGTRMQNLFDTNIPRAGTSGLPQAYEMLIFSIGVKMVRVMRPQTGATAPVFADGTGALSDPPTLQSLFNVDRITALSFKYREKTFSEGAMQDFPQGHGYSVFSTNASFELAQNGVPSPRDRNAMVLPIHIKENLSFVMAFAPQAAPVIAQPASDGGAVLNFTDVKTYLYGLIKRPVV